MVHFISLLKNIGVYQLHIIELGVKIISLLIIAIIL
jgi:hypothetical protein